MSDKIYALRLFNMFLGEGMSSILFEKIRNKRGLAYDIHSNLKMYNDCGSLIIYCEVNPAKAEDTIEVIKEIIDELKEEGLTEEELQEIKKQYLGSLQMKFTAT